jgi:hypothetical protein
MDSSYEEIKNFLKKNDVRMHNINDIRILNREYE